MENSNGEIQKKLQRTVIDQFVHITNPQERLRLKSSLNILTHLNKSDAKDLELKHTLTRIIRGLGASTSNARAGFYTILVALLNVNEINIEQIFLFIEKHLHTASSNSRSENADILTGQILAYGAIIRSNLWTNISVKDQLKVRKGILSASKERSYQGLLAYEFIIQSFDKLDERDFFKLCPELKDIVSTSLENYNLDSLYLLTYIQKKNPVSKHVKYPEIDSEENIGKLCNILMVIPRLSSLQHPIYDVIGASIAVSENLNTFVNETDKYLDVPNRNKILIVLKLYTSILKNLQNPSNIPNVLSKNFVHQILNHFKTLKGKDQDIEFKESINSFFETLLTSLKPDNIKSKTKIAVLKKLLFSPGTFIFEKITHSKIIQNITWSLNSEGVKKLSQVFKGVIEGTEMIDSQYGHGDYWLNNDKLYAAHLLIKLMNHKEMKDENDWKAEQLIYLAEMALLKNENIHIGNELAGSLKTAFFGSLDLKINKIEELHKILLQVVLHLDAKLTETDIETVLRTPITTAEYAIWERTVSTLKKIEKKKKKGGLRSVFLTLFLHLGLLIFNDAKLATDSLNELFVCYKKTRIRKDSETLEETTLEENNEELIWIEVVTDLFLNFLSQNSSLLRTIVNLVFPFLCEHMTPNTIHQLISVLDPENENPLSKHNTVSDDESEEDSDKEESEEDKEEDDEEDDDDEDDDENETVNDKLRMVLHQVLSSNGNQSDEESIDIDQMSETEGEKLDKALGEAFKQFRPNHGKSKKQKEDQKNLTHFRVRVLDLIEIYINSTPSMILALEIMLPLLKMVEFSIRDEHQTPLLNRLKSCLKKLSNIKKFCDTAGVDHTVLSDLLKSLLAKGTKSTWIVQDMGEQISSCCIFVIKCSDLLINFESTPKKVRKQLKNHIAEIITNELQMFFSKRESTTPILLFKNVLKLSWDGNLTLVPFLLGYLYDENIKLFRKTQAAELATIFYSNQRYLSSKPEVIKEILNGHQVLFSDNMISMFKNFCDNSTKKIVSEKFLCHIFRLLTSMKTCCLNIDSIKWAEIAESIREYRSTVTLSKDAKSAFNKLCDRLNVSHRVNMKPKVQALNTIEEGDKSSISREKKKHKKKNKEQLKLKKQAKELRLQSLSEGFKSLDFAAATDVNMDVDEDDDTNSFKKRKHKNSVSADDEVEELVQNRSNKIPKIKHKHIANSNNKEVVQLNGNSVNSFTKKKQK